MKREIKTLIKEIERYSEDYFKEILKSLLDQIPEGKITTYKVLAEALGSLYATKTVFRLLKGLEKSYKVVNERGEIKDLLQLSKLQKEGIMIRSKKDVEKYLFKDFKIEERPLIRLREIQKKLLENLILEDKFKKIDLVGGVDLSYKGNNALTVFVIMDKDLNVIEEKIFFERANFPYIPSFLAFREGIPIIKVFEKLENKPDILFVNGHGIAHPVKLGLATFVGIVLDIPTIGSTKSLLVGEERDGRIIYNGEQVGWVLENGKKGYVSPGHKISLEATKKISEMFWRKGPYPEPIRIADEISKKMKNKF